jgi:N12 class adenine-specific DNA methylase
VDGALVKREGGYFRPQPHTGKKLERMRGLIALRGAAREAIRAQTQNLPDDQILESRKSLNEEYGKFLKKYGPVNASGNAILFADDPDWPLLAGGLEDYDRQAWLDAPQAARENGSKGKEGAWSVTDKGDVILNYGKERYKIAKKRPIFRERTNHPPERITSVETGAEALAVSLNDLARIDWDRMQELTGRDPEQLQQELAGKIFRNPINRAWETADEYLSGNVRQKLKDAEFAAESNEEFAGNVAALKEVQPPDKEPGKIKAPLGAFWIPETYYAQFAEEVLKVERDPRAEQLVKYVPLTGGYAVRPNFTFLDAGVANKTEYGNAYYNGMDLFDMALNGQTPVARDTHYDIDGNEKQVKNPDATIELVEKQDRLKDAFTKWIWSDPERAAKLARKYNDEINNIKLREYDGSHLTFPGLNKSWMRSGEPEPHQKSAVWRTIQSGNTLYAHVVGAGKTLEGIMAAMELRRLGLAKKPMVVVPNHLVGQWRDDWMRAYPGAQILVPTKKDFEKENRQKLMSRIATGNYDGVIVGHKSFEKLSVSDETFSEFIESQLKEINDALDVAREGKSSKDEGKDPTIKQLRRRKATLEAKLEKRAKRDEKDNVLNFEDLGVDQLFVDEADLFKNLGYMTMMDRIAGLPNSDSDRATDMLLKTRHISNLRGGDRGVVFMTGTPVSNSIAEVWTMMRYLMPRYLEREGFDTFDAWAKTFGKTRTQMEVAPEGGRFIQRTRFSKFQNAAQMMNMFRLVADIKTAQHLNLPTPAVYKGGYVDVVAPASEALKAYVQEIGERADAIRNGEVEPEDDNMLKISSDGRKASLDIRLVDPSQPEDLNSKANQAVKNILVLHKEFAEHKAAQLVFLDLSTPKSEKSSRAKKKANDEIANKDADESAAANIYGEKEEEEAEEVETAAEARERFTVYDEMKRKLVAGGIRPEEIAFIQNAKTDAQKIDLFSKVNAGHVRVLIGSTEKMGAGMNVQQRLVALHHLDAPWRPRDMAQRDGRIVRQGNLLYNEHKIPVRLYRYMTEGSFDAFMWETLASKAAPIEQLMNGDPNMDDVDELSPLVLSFEQAKAISSGNPLIREKIILDQDIHKLEVMRGSWLSEQASIGRQLAELPGELRYQREKIAQYEADIATRDADPALVVDGKAYTGKELRAEGAPALIATLENAGDARQEYPAQEPRIEVSSLEAVPDTYTGFEYRERSARRHLRPGTNERRQIPLLQRRRRHTCDDSAARPSSWMR